MLSGRLPLSIALLASILSLAACGSNGDPEIEQTVRSLVASYNAKDVDGFLGKLTDKVVQEQYGVPREQATASVAKSIGEPSIEIRRRRPTSASGDDRLRTHFREGRRRGAGLNGERRRSMEDRWFQESAR